MVCFDIAKDFDLLIDANGNLKLCLKAGKVPPPDAEEDAPIDESRDALELLDGLCRMVCAIPLSTPKPDRINSRHSKTLIEFCTVIDFP
jgi:hypothetical protein